MSVLDNVLISKYKAMLGLDNISNNSGNTTIQGNVTINSNLQVSGQTIIKNNVTINIAC